MKPSPIHPQDRLYFQDFSREISQPGVTATDHYLKIQVGHTGEVKEGLDFAGLDFVTRHIERQHSILLVGCGYGAEAKWLVEHGYPNVTGLDIDPKLLEQFSQRFGLPTVCADMRRTGLESQSFDVVITHRSLHHLFYPFEALEELARLARHHVCIANEPTKSVLKDAYRRFTNGRIISGANIYEYQFDPSDVDRYMMFSGFQCSAFRRFWDSGRLSPAAIERMNKYLGCFGNRFGVVFSRFQ